MQGHGSNFKLWPLWKNIFFRKLIAELSCVMKFLLLKLIVGTLVDFSGSWMEKHK